MPVLERPSVVDPKLITSTKKPNNSLNRLCIIPANWNTSIAEPYVHKSIDTTGWNYAQNFRLLNIYESWTYTCSCCEGPILQCKNNETLGFKAAQWAEWYKNNTMSNATLEKPEVSNSAPAKTRRAKGSYAKEVSANIRPQILEAYARGATIVSLSQQFNVATTVVRDFLAQYGTLRGRGQVLNRSKGRTRTSAVITPEILGQAMIRFPEIGVVATAKELNVSPVELSAALKAEGLTISRGRKKA